MGNIFRRLVESVHSVQEPQSNEAILEDDEFLALENYEGQAMPQHILDAYAQSERKERDEAQFHTLVSATKNGNKFVQTLLGDMKNRHPEEGAQVFGKIMDYAGLEHSNLAQLNKASYYAYTENKSNADQRIVKHIAARM